MTANRAAVPVLLAFTLAAGAHAQAPVGMGLDRGSALAKEICLDPCDCLPRTFRAAAEGGYARRFAFENPLFTHYTIEGLELTAILDDREVTVRARGEYMIGGEVALQHRMTLRAVIDDQEWDFDSGFAFFDGRRFPAIDITLRTENLGCTRYTLVLRSSPTCPEDFNEDGFVDFFDYEAFVSCFEGSRCPRWGNPDFNADGFVDFFDYDDFVRGFETGC